MRDESLAVFAVGMMVGGMIAMIIAYQMISAYYQEKAVQHGCAEAAVEWQWKEER